MQNFDYDVIIVGAGPGGIFSAYELTKEDRGLKIAVFEAGHPLAELRHLSEHGSGDQPVKRRPGSRTKGNHEPDEGPEEQAPEVARPSA